MAASVDISLLGDKALKKKFDRLAAKLQTKFAAKALRAGGKPILTAAKANAPVDRGKMRQHLKLRALKRRGGNIGVAIQNGTREQLGIPPDDPSYYPLSVETGTATIPAQPFMRPALKDNEQTSRRIIGRVLWQEIDKESKRP